MQLTAGEVHLQQPLGEEMGGGVPPRHLCCPQAVEEVIGEGNRMPRLRALVVVAEDVAGVILEGTGTLIDLRGGLLLREGVPTLHLPGEVGDIVEEEAGEAIDVRDLARAVHQGGEAVMIDSVLFLATV